MYGYIYKTTNTINGKIYVGQKKSTAFVSTYFGSGKLIREALKKYGKQNFTLEILEECYSQEELDNKERFWINYFGLPDISIGYNITIGGQSRFFTGQKHSDQTRKKMSDRALNRPHPPTTLGRIYINNGLENKCIEEQEVDKYLSSGWVVGRLDRNLKIWNKGKTKENNESIKKYSDTRKKQISEGKIIGFCGLPSEKNVNYKSDEDLIEEYINNGFRNIWWEYGRSYAVSHFHMNFKTLERCLKLIGEEETPEHKKYIRQKGRKNSIKENASNSGKL